MFCVFLDHEDVAKYVLNSATARQFMQLSQDFGLLWLASGQDFQNTPRPAVPYFMYFESMCAEYPILSEHWIGLLRSLTLCQE